jgi:hypothetical protein
MGPSWGPFLVWEPCRYSLANGTGIGRPKRVGTVEVPGRHLEHPTVLEVSREGPLNPRWCEAILGGQEAEARRG